MVLRNICALQHLMGGAQIRTTMLTCARPPRMSEPIPPRHRRTRLTPLNDASHTPASNRSSTHIKLSLTLRPDTVSGYRGVTRRFLSYLRAASTPAPSPPTRRDPPSARLVAT
jgi:hypothetical protein